jgi:glycosyltransferase involved in cell wall biosynthesis
MSRGAGPRTPASPSVVVAVIPVFNEAATVAGVVTRLRDLCPVIVVDDASTDTSAVRAAAAGASCVIRTGRRTGKGGALRAGFAEALRRDAGAVVTVDGDGQHDPGDLPRLLAAARRAPGALVVGDRLRCRGGDRIPRVRRLAIRAADRFVRWLTRTPICDTQCGFRVYPAAFLRAVALREEGFVLETEALVGAARRGHALVSVPVRAIYPPGRASRFRALADGVQIGRYIAREVLREAPRRLAAEVRGRRVRVSGPVHDA